MQTSEWRVGPGSMTTWTKVMRGSEKGDLEIVAKTYSIKGCSAEGVANLVAAAPSLLAALREAKSELIELYERAYPEDESDNDTTRVIDAVVNAIAKAEGRG